MKKFLKIGLVSSLLVSGSFALEVNLTKDLPYVDVDVNGKNVRIERIQGTKHKRRDSYTKTS